MGKEEFKPDLELIEAFLRFALEEDLGSGDHTSLATIPEEIEGRMKLLIKDSGIIAGIDLAKIIFRFIDSGIQFESILRDGNLVTTGEIAFYVQGKVHSLLKAERLVLNCMQRMSGIATMTHQIVEQLKSTHTHILDTRKTTPGFRYFEKWAVLIGGGVNHRFGLYDAILIKDNHVDFAGGIENALNMVKTYILKNEIQIPIIIEVRSFLELDKVLEIGGVDRILLDNFPVQDLARAVRLVDGKIPLEASGGISSENVLEYAQTGVDYISLGAITHSHPNFDLSLKAL